MAWLAFFAFLLRSQGGQARNSNGTEEIVADLRTGKFAAARVLIEAELKDSPDDLRLLTLNGFALRHLGDTKNALQSYARALKISPNYLPALEGSAEIEYSLSDQAAVPILERILQLRPNDETARGMLGSLAYERGDCKSTVEQFGQGQTVMASQPRALEQYGSCLVKLKRLDEALPVFQHLSEIQHHKPGSLYNLAVVQLMAKRYQEAIATLTSVPPGERPDAELLALLAEAYEATSETPRAVAMLRQAIMVSPDDPKYYLSFANLCLTHDAFQVGVDVMNAGLKRQPEAAPLYLARGILYIQLSQYDQAQDDFAKAHTLDPNLDFGASAQGLAELQRNDLPKAEATVRQRLKEKPNDAFLHYLLTETLVRRGAVVGTPQFTEAVRSAERAVQLQPSLALARDVLGRLYLQEDKTDQAIAQSRLAFHDDPNDQTALYHLILALRKGGKKDEVPALLKQLADLREKARTKEAAEHRYQLVEVAPASTDSLSR